MSLFLFVYLIPVKCFSELSSCSHFTPAQGTRSDYERANGLRELTENKVYKTKAEPHWFSNNFHFWYRNDLPGGSREFVVIDTAWAPRTGQRNFMMFAGKISAAPDFRTGFCGLKPLRRNIPTWTSRV